MINVSKKIVQFLCFWGMIKESFCLPIHIGELYLTVYYVKLLHKRSHHRNNPFKHNTSTNLQQIQNLEVALEWCHRVFLQKYTSSILQQEMKQNK